MRAENGVILVGGYGVVGEQVVGILQELHPELMLYCAGRNPRKADALVRSFANVRALKLDVNQKVSFQGLNPRAIVGMVNDPHDHLLMEAVRSGVPFVDITRWTARVQSALGSLAGQSLRAPVLLSSGWMAGVTSILALSASRLLATVESIDISVLYALKDKSGPNAVDYMDRLATPFQSMCNGSWTSVFPLTSPRSVRFPGGYQAKVYRLDTPDHYTLPAVTGAATVSARIAFDNLLTTKMLVVLARSGVWKLLSGPRFKKLRHALLYNPGPGAGHEIVVELSGLDTNKKPKTVRASLVDPQGQTHLTALGVSIQLRRILGLDGAPPPAAAIVYPDTAPHLEAALQLLSTHKVQVKIE